MQSILIYSRKSAETLISIVIGVVILAVIGISLGNLMVFNHDIEKEFDSNNDSFLLDFNTKNILPFVDTSKVVLGETFVIYRNPSTKAFEVFTGSLNVAKYAVVDRNGINILDTSIYSWDLYTRTFVVSKLDSLAGKNGQIITPIIQKYIQ